MRPARVELVTKFVIVHAPAEVVIPRVGRWGTVEELNDLRCRLRMDADSLEWPMMALGVIGEEFEIIAPPAMFDYAREWADRFDRAVCRAESANPE